MWDAHFLVIAGDLVVTRRVSVADIMCTVDVLKRLAVVAVLVLPMLPDGFASPQVLLAQLDQAQARQLEAQQHLTAHKAEAARLTAVLADRRSEEIVEQADEAKALRPSTCPWEGLPQDLQRTRSAGGSLRRGFAGGIWRSGGGVLFPDYRVCVVAEVM